MALIHRVTEVTANLAADRLLASARRSEIEKFAALLPIIHGVVVPEQGWSAKMGCNAPDVRQIYGR
jgi:hypothetical protein